MSEPNQIDGGTPESGDCGCTGTTAAPELRKGWGADLPMVLLIAMLGVVVMFGLYHPVIVEGTSMLPQLENEDRLFINQVAYSRLGSLVGESIQRGDVVVFRFPQNLEKSYIKRVIAVPGDVLQIDHGQVFINGAAVPEPYVPARFTDERSISPDDAATGQVFRHG